MRSGRKPSLTPDIVRSLRDRLEQRRARGTRSRWIKQEAKRLNVSTWTVLNAIRGSSYRWVQ